MPQAMALDRQRADPLVAIIVIAASVFIIAASVNLQVPLYTTYAASDAKGTGGVSLMFASYAATLIPLLFLFGGISDVIGRRIVLIGGMAASLTATAAMTLVPSASMLFIARALQGASIALSISTATAWLADLGAAQRASPVVAGASAIGFGSGALATSIFLMHRQTPRPGSFVIVLALTIVSLFLVWLLPDAGGGGRLRPVLPRYPPGTLTPAVSIFLAWTASSVVISLVPTQLRAVGLALWSGPALFAVNATGFLAQVFARRMSEQTMLRIACAITPAGFAILAAGAVRGELALILGGAAITGSTAYGLAWVGGFRAVTAAARDGQASAVAGYLLAAYAGFSLPAVAAGFLAERIGAARTLYVLAAFLLLGEAGAALMLRRARR